jgi:hypothetical protein
VAAEVEHRAQAVLERAGDPEQRRVVVEEDLLAEQPALSNPMGLEVGAAAAAASKLS